MPYAMLAFLSLLWGSSFLLIKIASRGFEPFGFALGRVGIGAAALAAVALASREVWPKGRRLWGRLAMVSIVGQITPFVLLGVAAKLTTSADLALVMGGVPIFSFLLSRMLGVAGQGGARVAMGLACGLAGVAISVGFPFGAGDAAHPLAGWGRGIALIAAFGYGAGALLSRAASLEVGATMAATASMTISTILLFGLWLAWEGVPSAAGVAATPVEAVAALVILGVFNTALAYFVYFRLVVAAGATFAALNNYIVPFIGMALGWAILGEPIAPTAWLGFALVIGGVVLMGSAGAPRANARPRLASGDLE
jgi:drug/metabolite transporter (DMT)-like permease